MLLSIYANLRCLVSDNLWFYLIICWTRWFLAPRLGQCHCIYFNYFNLLDYLLDNLLLWDALIELLLFLAIICYCYLLRWSFASLMVPLHPSLRKSINDFVGSGAAAQLSAIDVSSIAWAMAILQWHSHQMMDAGARWGDDRDLQGKYQLWQTMADPMIADYGSYGWYQVI